MRIINLHDPITVEGATIHSITVHPPTSEQLRGLRGLRKETVGFAYRQTIIAASRLTAFGEMTLLSLSAVDYAQLSLAIEEAFQAAIGNNDFRRFRIEQERSHV